MFPPIMEPEGEINEQSSSPKAMQLRTQVQNGITLYRIGTTGRSRVGANAQYWSTVNPLTNPSEYAKTMGIPKENVVNADFIETAVLRPSYPFVVNEAPAARGETGGGGLQVVVLWGGTQGNQISPINR